MSDLTIKPIKDIYNTKACTKEQVRKYKRDAKEYVSDSTGIYIRQDLNLSVIMHYRTPTEIEFRSELGFNQHDIIMTKENSVLT